MIYSVYRKLLRFVLYDRRISKLKSTKVLKMAWEAEAFTNEMKWFAISIGRKYIQISYVACFQILFISNTMFFPTYSIQPNIFMLILFQTIETLLWKCRYKMLAFVSKLSFWPFFISFRNARIWSNRHSFKKLKI